MLNKLTPYKTTVKSSDGLWYQMQIMPYRTSENVIAGVVITFVDITQEKKLGEQLLDFKKEYEHILEMTKTVVYTQNDQLIYTSMANIHSDFQFRNIIGKKDGDLFSKEDAKKLDNIKRKVLDTGKPQRATLELKISGEARYYDLMVRPIGEDQKIT